MISPGIRIGNGNGNGNIKLELLASYYPAAQNQEFLEKTKHSQKKQARTVTVTVKVIIVRYSVPPTKSMNLAAMVTVQVHNFAQAAAS